MSHGFQLIDHMNNSVNKSVKSYNVGATVYWFRYLIQVTVKSICSQGVTQNLKTC